MKSFVIRLWAPGAGAADHEAQALRGVVARVADGETHTFASSDELIEFLTLARDVEYGASSRASAALG